MKKRWSVIAVGCFAWLLGLAIQLYEPVALQNFSNQIEDVLRRAVSKPVQSDRIVILDIDENSLRKIGQWPWPRTVLADVVDRLWQEGAAAVAWDGLFAEPDRTSPRYLLESWCETYGEVSLRGVPEERADHDAVFANALGHGLTILGIYGELGTGNSTKLQVPSDVPDARVGAFYEQGRPDHSWLPTARYCVHPIEPLRRAARNEAFLNTLTDEDNVVRRTPLIMAHVMTCIRRLRWNCSAC